MPPTRTTLSLTMEVTTGVFIFLDKYTDFFLQFRDNKFYRFPTHRHHSMDIFNNQGQGQLEHAFCSALCTASVLKFHTT